MHVSERTASFGETAEEGDSRLRQPKPRQNIRITVSANGRPQEETSDGTLTHTSEGLIPVGQGRLNFGLDLSLWVTMGYRQPRIVKSLSAVNASLRSVLLRSHDTSMYMSQNGGPLSKSTWITAYIGPNMDPCLWAKKPEGH